MSRMKQCIATLSLFVLLLAGCNGAPATPTPTPTPEVKIFKLGVLGPFSGPSQATGIQVKRAAIMAFEEVDYKLGEYEVELVWIDSQSDPEVAIQAYEQAIEDGIQAGILNWHSNVAVSMMEVTAEHQIPHFFTMGATELVNQKFQANPDSLDYWNFKAWPAGYKLTVNYVEAIEEAIAQGAWEPATKRAGICSEDTDWGHSIANGLKVQLREAGWEIAAEHYLALDATDFTEAVESFEAQEVVLVGGTATGDEFFPSFLEQAEAANFEAMIIADGLGWLGNWYEWTEDASDYVMDQSPLWVTEQARAFAEAYEARWESKASPSISGLSYDYTHFFIQIAQQTLETYGELNRETLHRFGQEYVQTGEVVYTDGMIMETYKYTPESVPDPVVGAGYYLFPVVQYLNGESNIIWPEAWKEADLQVEP